MWVQNKLADIAIKQGELDKGEKLLNIGLVVAEWNKDKGLSCDYQCCFAYLERARGNIEKSQEHGKKAIDGFNRLGMLQESEDMRTFLL